MIQTIPRNLSETKIEIVLASLAKISCAIRERNLPVEGGLTVTLDEKFQLKNDVLVCANEYQRCLALINDTREALQHAEHYQDHDRLASTLLYLVARFQKMQNAKQRDFLPSFDRWCFTRVSRYDGHTAGIIRAMLPLLRHRETYDVGILTVLEHEYQSVIRRLDEIFSCTDDHSYGFAILDRRKPDQDLKKIGKPQRSTGWTHGRIGKTNVLVVCTGPPADDANSKDTTTAALDAISRVFSHKPERGWLVVGVCAGTNEKWPIGTVLVSEDSLFDMRSSHTQGSSEKSRFKLMGTITPCEWLTWTGKNAALEVLFRPIPNADGLQVQVAKPTSVPVRRVKFACTHQVVNATKARLELCNHLRADKKIRKDEEIGIEMEGAGVAAFGESSVCVVKAVCDYANNSKAKGWEKFKVLFQLFAAETAADFVVQAIKAVEKKRR
jgi:nucleoside phosphorylase